MSTQQSAQERAEKWCAENVPTVILGRAGQLIDARNIDAERAFLAGEISGHQRAMDEMSAKASEGFEGFFDRKKATQDDLRVTNGMGYCDTLIYYIRKSQQEARAPLLSKIADLEAQNKKLGDVVLEMVKVLDSIRSNCNDWVTVEDAGSLLDDNSILIDQLKQERGE